MLDWHSCQICYPIEIKLLLFPASRCLAQLIRRLTRRAYSIPMVRRPSTSSTSRMRRAYGFLPLDNLLLGLSHLNFLHLGLSYQDALCQYTLHMDVRIRKFRTWTFGSRTVSKYCLSESHLDVHNITYMFIYKILTDQAILQRIIRDYTKQCEVLSS